MRPGIISIFVRHPVAPNLAWEFPTVAELVSRIVAEAEEIIDRRLPSLRG